MSPSGIALVRGAFDAFDRRDLDALLDLTDPEIELSRPRRRSRTRSLLPGPRRDRSLPPGRRTTLGQPRGAPGEVPRGRQPRRLRSGGTRARGATASRSTVPTAWVWEIRAGKLCWGCVYADPGETFMGLSLGASRRTSHGPPARLPRARSAPNPALSPKTPVCSDWGSASLHYVSGLSMGTEIRRRRRAGLRPGCCRDSRVRARRRDRRQGRHADRAVRGAAVRAAVGASRTQTLIVALYSIALTVPAGLIDGIFGDFEHVLKPVVVAVVAWPPCASRRSASGRAGQRARPRGRERARRQPDAGRRRRPGCSRQSAISSGWQAGALWEITQGESTLRCVSTWLAPKQPRSSSSRLQAAARVRPRRGACRASCGTAGSRNGSTTSEPTSAFRERSRRPRRGSRARLRFPIVGSSGRRRRGRVLRHRRAPAGPP